MHHEYWLTLLLTCVALVVAYEVAFQVGRRTKDEVAAEKKTAVDAVGAAMLALLGLLLGFTFSMADERYAARRHIVLDEVNAIGTTYLRAKMLPPPHDVREQDLLRQYVEMRTVYQTPSSIQHALDRTADLHNRLWDEARAAAALDTHSHITALFIESLNNMIDLHTARITVNIYQRLPSAIRDVLYIAAVLSVGVFGYGVGLRRRRAFGPTAAMMVAISLVLTVIVDFNRAGDPVVHGGIKGYKDLQTMMSRDRAATR